MWCKTLLSSAIFKKRNLKPTPSVSSMSLCAHLDKPSDLIFAQREHSAEILEDYNDKHGINSLFAT